MPGPTYSLNACRDAGRRFDLQHEVDRTHVDAQLEGGRGDEPAQGSGLELVLDEESLLAGDGAVMRAHEVLLGQLVDACGDPLGQAP